MRSPLLNPLIVRHRVIFWLAKCDLRRARRETAAEKIGVSSSHLGKSLIKANTSWNKLLDAERIKRLDKALLQGEQDSRTLSTAMGFIQRNSFYMSFRRWKGCSFGQYMRTQKQAA